jgi:phosphoenolpyruvate carboxylase
MSQLAEQADGPSGSDSEAQHTRRDGSAFGRGVNHASTEVTLDFLAARVRRLGNLLGQVIVELGGRRVFELVEYARGLAKSGRAGNAEAARQLFDAVRRLPVGEAFELAMAFTTYFELVNLAEEDYRTRRLRHHRTAQRSVPAEARPPVRESIEAAVLRLKELGVTPEEMQDLLDGLSIELVLTAHPTESKRRTILTRLRRIADALRREDDRPAADNREGPADGALRREITALWLTDRSRALHPAVTDEVRTGLWYFGNTLWDAVPRLQADLEQALAEHYPGVCAPEKWLTFGSWVGGDRDGNSNVTADVSAETLRLHRRFAVDRARVAIRELSRLLSISRRRAAVSPEIVDRIEISRFASPHVQALASRYPNEPYRVVLAELAARLDEAWSQIGAHPLNRGVDFSDVPSSDGDDAATPLRACDVGCVLDAVSRSLQQSCGATLADGELKTLRRQLGVFGLHVARLDVRQHSAWHETAVAEIGANLADGDRRAADYTALGEAERLAVLDESLARPLPDVLGPFAAWSDATRSVVEPIRLAREAVRRYGREAVGVYVVSMTDALSDVLEVLLLMRWCRAELAIVPLFETLRDLERAPDILRAMFSHPHYRAHVRSNGDRQMVMLGYSDSNKDCGYIAANWALFKAQETIARACHDAGVSFTLFHGRGGTIARGGGPAAQAILAQPTGLLHGGIRITEQGEVLSSRYHDPDIAHRHLEQVAYGTLLALHRSRHPAPVPQPWQDSLERMAAAGHAAYRALVYDDPDFLAFWQAATPINDIGELKLGSRPAYRRQTRSVADLRAIPWVFSWMQSRFVLPGWYGLGAALDSEAAGDALLREMYRKWPFFQTLIDNAQQSLSKADLGIAEQYASLVEAHAIRERIFGLIRAEFECTCRAICRITGQSALLDNEPVLQRSIQLRNPYVDPLNFIQIAMIRRLRERSATSDPARSHHPDADEEALRAVVELTINGLSSGLRNTG